MRRNSYATLSHLGQLLLGFLEFVLLLLHVVLLARDAEQRLHSRVQLPPLPVAHRQPAPDVALDDAQSHSAATPQRSTNLYDELLYRSIGRYRRSKHL